MNNQERQQVLQQLQTANNVLVTVSTNPTVDELAASIALTIVLNRMEKHATTVFSGVVPSTIEFLQPEKTIETTTDSLRDFIIALDKSKADKLRYKVFELKMDQVEATGADTVLSTCSNCRQSYNDAKEHFNWDKEMESLLELVAENLVEA